jgi:hypothetical protein
MLKLYYSPGACSLAPHIVLEEIGQPYKVELVSTMDGSTRTDAYLKVHAYQRSAQELRGRRAAAPGARRDGGPGRARRGRACRLRVRRVCRLRNARHLRVPGDDATRRPGGPHLTRREGPVPGPTGFGRRAGAGHGPHRDIARRRRRCDAETQLQARTPGRRAGDQGPPRHRPRREQRQVQRTGGDEESCQADAHTPPPHGMPR